MPIRDNVRTTVSSLEISCVHGAHLPELVETAVGRTL